MMSELDELLRIHADAWWRDTEATDFVWYVNATYDAYLNGGGNDAHYDANWRAFSDAAKRARPLPMDGQDFHHEGEE
jgi:hypothetical protein